ncbi:MAG: hypothetical protein ACC656_05520 [Candidatus Heimdallarchaeota archaeon]
MFKWFKKKNKIITEIEFGHYVVKVDRPVMWKPKVYILQKSIPGIKPGTRFQQSYQSDNVYFYAIAISASISECDQVGIIEFEARYVENNLEWFIEKKEYDIQNDIRNDYTKFFYN